MFDALKKAYSRATGGEDPSAMVSLGFGVCSAFCGQLVAFPLETVARRMQVVCFLFPFLLFLFSPFFSPSTMNAASLRLGDLCPAACLPTCVAGLPLDLEDSSCSSMTPRRTF